MSQISQPIPTVTPSAIATFNFTDIASKTGFITFFAGRTANDDVLSNNQFYANQVSIVAAAVNVGANEGAAVADIDIDFDITLNNPQTLKGDVTIEIPHGWRDSGDQTTIQKAKVIIRHWDGSTETDLLTITGDAWTAIGQSAATETLTTLTSLSGDLPERHFKRGETLRITIQLLTWEAGANLHDIILGADPQGRLQTDRDSDDHAFPDGAVTILRCFIPFRIDI